nr:hypothetical protein [Lachnospiraceae bacterium]
ERTRVGIFGKDTALKLSEIQALKDEDRLSEIVKSVDGLFPDYPQAYVSKEALYKLENGNILQTNEINYVNQNAINLQSCVRVYRPDGSFAGIYKCVDGVYKPEKMFL